MPSSLNRESEQNAASPDAMGESSSTGTARLDRTDSFRALQLRVDCDHVFGWGCGIVGVCVLVKALFSCILSYYDAMQAELCFQLPSMQWLTDWYL